MSLSMVAALLWLLLANVRAMFPSKDHLWKFAYFLIALGVPILIWVFADAGWLPALVFLIAGASVLRWPVIYLGRWLRRVTGA